MRHNLWHFDRRPAWVALLLLLLCLPLEARGRGGPAYGVYLRLADGPAGSYPAMVAAVPDLAARGGMRLLTSRAVNTGGCRYQATVFVLEAPEWTRLVLAQGTRAAFAAPIRLAVYEDETGVHLALANPQSLARTMVAESFDGPAAAVVEALAAAVRDGFPGTAVAQPYGQIRDRGLIGRTMGIVAGGPFASKVETIGKWPDPAERGMEPLLGALAREAGRPTVRWGLRLAYRYDLPDGAGAILGFSGAAMEAKSFAIVGEGGDAARKGFACPGIDHAPAYPIELLVLREDGKIAVLLTDVMFRMKMYFEDAGTMKFAANMAMPGSIEDELRGLVEDALDATLDRAAVR